VLGNPVVVTVEGLNIIGYSVPSDKNTAGAVIRTQPLVPNVAVYRVDDGTTDIKIKAQYDNLLVDEQTGGSPILSLNLWYD
jgi:hypothetical protein